jgi:hypothetical protein
MSALMLMAGMVAAAIALHRNRLADASMRDFPPPMIVVIRDNADIAALDVLVRGVKRAMRSARSGSPRKGIACCDSATTMCSPTLKACC